MDVSDLTTTAPKGMVHMPPARERSPVSSQTFQDVIDGIYLELARTIGTEGSDGTTLYTGYLDHHRDIMIQIEDDQWKTGQAPQGFFLGVYGVNDAADSDAEEGTRKANRVGYVWDGMR